MIDALYLWNRWGSNALHSGVVRDVMSRISPYFHTEEIIALTGPRRAGKSTVLYQVMDALESEGISKEAILHINFEEPKLSSYLNVEGLDALYDCFRTHIYPQGKAYVFLDEIQNIPEWERWVRARVKTEEIKVFVTGSSAKMMSRELGSLLTGRHLSFEIMPLSFSEFLRFQKIEVPERLAATPLIRHALENYLQWGGFPKVVLAKTEQHKRDILLEYFDDILFKDILLRHSIRDTMLLRHLVCHLLTQTGKLISFQRIANIFEVSNDLSVNYCNYAQEAYLVEFLPFFSIKAAVRQRHPQKTHALDLGLRNVVSLGHSQDDGHLIETVVYAALRRHFGDKVYYWQNEGEVDFVVHQGNGVSHIFQVITDGLEDEKIRERELTALQEASQKFPKAKCFIVAKNLPKKNVKMPFTVIPLWLFLLRGIE